MLNRADGIARTPQRSCTSWVGRHAVNDERLLALISGALCRWSVQSDAQRQCEPHANRWIEGVSACKRGEAKTRPRSREGPRLDPTASAYVGLRKIRHNYSVIWRAGAVEFRPDALRNGSRVGCMQAGHLSPLPCSGCRVPCSGSEQGNNLPCYLSAVRSFILRRL